MMIKPEFTPEEALALRNLLDVAVRHPSDGGMRIAQACVVLDQKILAAAKAAEAQKTLDDANAAEAAKLTSEAPKE